MSRATRADIVTLLTKEGAVTEEAEAIVVALERAELNPSQMRVWLADSARAYNVSVGATVLGVDLKQVPTHAIEGGRADAVQGAAERFAAAAPEERMLCRTFLCDLDAVRRLSRGEDERLQLLCEAAGLLRGKLKKDIAVSEALQTTLSGNFDDTTRLVDWMSDDRLAEAVEALRTGAIDVVELRKQGPLHFVGW